jgi:hypothetical protein
MIVALEEALLALEACAQEAQLVISKYGFDLILAHQLQDAMAVRPPVDEVSDLDDPVLWLQFKGDEEFLEFIGAAVDVSDCDCSWHYFLASTRLGEGRSSCMLALCKFNFVSRSK